MGLRRLLLVGLLLASLLLPELALAQDALLDVVSDSAAGVSEDGVSSAVRLIVLLTALAMLPALVLLMTPFTRFVIVLSLLRQALGLQQSPPNQVLIGLALAMSLVVMNPTLTAVQEDALRPYMAGEISTELALERGMRPMRLFMLEHTRKDDLGSALRMARVQAHSAEDVPTPVVMTAFVLSELRAAFSIAVRVYIPFLVVDLIIASILLGMGMMMLPPVVVSLPFKLLVFVLMDGWTLLVNGLVGGYG